MNENRLQWGIRKGIKIAILAVAGVVVFGFLVKGLWNWLMPALFAWHAITFWQAIGLFLLCKILFGGFRGGPGRRMHWRRRMEERWGQMSAEEREKFSQGIKGPFGHCDFRGRASGG